MNSIIYSSSAQGSYSQLIAIECQLSNGLPTMTIVGMGNKSVEEAKERVRGAFASSHIQLPKKHIILNLAPADVPKEGSSFDLAMAVAILSADQQIKIKTSIKRLVIYGELGLTGEIRPVRGIIGSLLHAKSCGATTAIIPAKNLSQANLVEGFDFIPVGSLQDVFSYFTASFTPTIQTADEAPKAGTKGTDFSTIMGQLPAKRAAEIAAAGGHNILLDGPPGTGKSMVAKAICGILPPMTKQEIVEVTHIHSLHSANIDHVVYERPFQSPHHSTSTVAILGGGPSPRPGAVSLSHKGILLLDELPEFGRHIIDSLRQPLEDKVISISRAKNSIIFPADCMLVATRNPCPCGYYGTSQCCCSPTQILQYQKRISGPVLDRIDLYVQTEAVDHKKLLANSGEEETSETIAQRVTTARTIQSKRYSNPSKTNSLLSNEEIKVHCALSSQDKEFLDAAASKLSLSARGYMRVLKVARTIADLDKSPTIQKKHLAEAFQYRPKQLSL